MKEMKFDTKCIKKFLIFLCLKEAFNGKLIKHTIVIILFFPGTTNLINVYIYTFPHEVHCLYQLIVRCHAWCLSKIKNTNRNKQTSKMFKNECIHENTVSLFSKKYHTISDLLILLSQYNVFFIWYGYFIEKQIDATILFNIFFIFS